MKNIRYIAKKAFLSSLPVLAGYIVLGIGFGLLLSSKGYSVLWALPMSLFIYAGSMQYLAIDLLAGGASLITAAITTLMVNARHLFYGISMIDKYKNTGLKKPYLIFSLTDETYSLNCGKIPENIDDPSMYFLFISIFNHFYWVTGSVIGALLGNIIPFNTEGIDFALTALFVTIFVDQWKSVKNHRAALIGLSSSIFCLLVFKADNFLIPTMILITVLLLLDNNSKRGAENE